MGGGGWKGGEMGPYSSQIGDQRRGTKDRRDPVDRTREKAWVYSPCRGQRGDGDQRRGPKIKGTLWTVPEGRHGSTRVPVHAVAREGMEIKGGGPKIKGTRWTVPQRRHGSTRVPVHAMDREWTVIKGGGPKIQGRVGQCQREGMGLLEYQSMPWPERGR
jgi:hypothetical protein